MAWNTPITWAAIVVTVSNMNQQIRDNLNILKTSIANDGTLASTGGLLTNPEVRGPKGTKVSTSISAGLVAVDLNAADFFDFSVTANWALSVTNLPASGKYAAFYVMTIGNGSTFTATWPTSIKWPGAVVPIVTPTSAKRDVYLLQYDPAVPQWYGHVVGQNL